jgi:hypothetical protein
MKSVFKHCPECDLYKDCYEFFEGEIDGGPNFLEPSCVEPFKKPKTSQLEPVKDAAQS